MRSRFFEPEMTPALISSLERNTYPSPQPSHLKKLIEHVKSSRIVMLGEASHGTKEFYTWRTEVTKILIEEHGFNFVAVEGDWPPCYAVNQYVSRHSGPQDPATPDQALSVFNRWPTWMWANEETASLVAWLKTRNANKKSVAGFYGLDLYSLWESTQALMHLLYKKDNETFAKAKNVLDCFQYFGDSAEAYARACSFIPNSCHAEVLDLLQELKKNQDLIFGGNENLRFLANQNAHVVKNAEEYYRTMMTPGPESWNIRDLHMFETLQRLIDNYGERSKGIVWEHNTHVGDARYTDMIERRMLNIGQLARQIYGHDQVSLVGFSTYEGNVIAARSWGAPAQEMVVPPARENSWEDVFHKILSNQNGFFLSQGEKHGKAMMEPRGHRAIGVVYNPSTEAYGNYVPTVLPMRYDAWVFIDKTSAVTPIEEKQRSKFDAPETFPSAV
ncbi:MAG: erythromycin esterase family protein [Oligoflexales bacterium]